MPELFRLIEEKFSEIYQEWQWTYLINFDLIFNEQKITKITITGYTWTKKGREMITKELILNIFQEIINGREMEPEPKKNPAWKREHFVSKKIPFNGKKYKLVFWFKDGTINHLWIKNCYQQD